MWQSSYIVLLGKKKKRGSYCLKMDFDFSEESIYK